MRVSPEDGRLVRDFLRRWDAASAGGRQRLHEQAPVEAMQGVALHDEDPWIRRECLSFLDHYTSDASTEVFLVALRDPVPPVREIALHGLACERCRTEPLCIADTIGPVIEILASDPSPEVRYKTLTILVGLATRRAEAVEAIRRAAVEDDDALVREAATLALAGKHLPSRERLRRRARSRKAKARRVSQ